MILSRRFFTCPKKWGFTLLIALVTALLLSTTAAQPLALSGHPTYGQAGQGAEIVIVKDFSCPHCKSFTEAIFPSLQTLADSGDAHIIFVNYAFMAPTSLQAAIASECLYQQDADSFWPFEKAVFAAQNSSRNWATPGWLRDVALEAYPELNTNEFSACSKSGEGQVAVEQDNMLARMMGIRGVPSVFVDGQPVSGQDFSTWPERIAAEGVGVLEPWHTPSPPASATPATPDDGASCIPLAQVDSGTLIFCPPGQHPAN